MAANMAEVFSRRRLLAMMAPLFMEQLLIMLVGIVDTLMVSYLGEAAVSGVSLVNQFNIIFLYLFLALASGGAVVISQYIGREEEGHASEAASQLLLISAAFSLVLAVFVLALGDELLSLLFGAVEPEVMEACHIYLCVSAYSYPFLAVYNAGAALYRSLGRTSVTMYISCVSNAINAAGAAWSIFILGAGVEGVAYASLAARVFSALAITWLCFREKGVAYSWEMLTRLSTELWRRILAIAVPNGMESGVFQLVKVALTSMVALFGTYQIAANGVAQSIWSLAALAGVAMGPIFITVIGQCVGARDYEAAELYFHKLGKYTLIISVLWNLLILILTPPLLELYALEEETKSLVLWLVLIHNVFNAVAFPYSGAFASGLRAAGDVKYTMYVSIASTIGGRLLLSYLLGIVLDLGVIGLALAMVADWVIRALFFLRRERAGKWREYQVI